MTIKGLDFECALITGGAGGLGRAIAEWFLSEGKKVIIVGRTESKLQETSKALKNCPYYVLDTGDIASIPSFVQKVAKEHPEIDFLINNAGVQRVQDINKFDLESADQEIDINIRGPMHLAIKFLPHFKSKKHAIIANVSSILGFVPFSIINPVYNATKAFQHFWSTTLRTQLEGTNVRIMEIAPPAVGTDLHRDREDPDDNKKHKNKIALTVEEFMTEIKQHIAEGKDFITAGPGVETTNKWFSAFDEQYQGAAKKYVESKK